jgi:hypothetical protein
MGYCIKKEKDYNYRMAEKFSKPKKEKKKPKKQK